MLITEQCPKCESRKIEKIAFACLQENVGVYVRSGYESNPEIVSGLRCRCLNCGCLWVRIEQEKRKEEVKNVKE